MENTEADAMAMKCSELNEKLNLLLQALHTEAQAAPVLPPVPSSIAEKEGEESSSEESSSDIKDQLRENSTAAPALPIFKPREQLMLRANSLKKALRQLIEQAEKVVDEQNAHTEEQVNQTPTEYSKELDESKDEEKEEDTKEIESHPMKTAPKSPDGRRSRISSHASTLSAPVCAASKENLPVLNTRIICPGGFVSCPV
ncbi:UNVERIFIED_CONTAM: hypothetical protein K2H54_003194 [Gekko kuhli]